MCISQGIRCMPQASLGSQRRIHVDLRDDSARSTSGRDNPYRVPNGISPVLSPDPAPDASCTQFATGITGSWHLIQTGRRGGSSLSVTRRRSRAVRPFSPAVRTGSRPLAIASPEPAGSHMADLGASGRRIVRPSRTSALLGHSVGVGDRRARILEPLARLQRSTRGREPGSQSCCSCSPPMVLGNNTGVSSLTAPIRFNLPEY